MLPTKSHATPEYAFLRQTTRTKNAAIVLKGVVEPTSILSVTRIEQSLAVVAHLSEGIPRYWLLNSTALEALVDAELRFNLGLAVEAKVLSDQRHLRDPDAGVRHQRAGHPAQWHHQAVGVRLRRWVHRAEPERLGGRGAGAGTSLVAVAVPSWLWTVPPPVGAWGGVCRSCCCTNRNTPTAWGRSVSGADSRCTYHAVADAIDRTERYLTACHEAGHAVAAVLRGGTFDSISIEPTVTRDGFIHTRGVKACDAEFVKFAGPWAGARADWPALPLDGVDGDGSTFDDYLRASMRANANDLRQYVPEHDIPFELLFTAGGEVPKFLWRGTNPGTSNLKPVGRQFNWSPVC